MSIPRFVVMPTYNRPEIGRDAIDSIGVDADMILVIDNGDQNMFPRYQGPKTLTPYYVRRVDEQPVNLSRLWNIGLDWAQEEARKGRFEEWDVAIINDDVLLPYMWLSDVQRGLRAMNVAAACTGPVSNVLTEPGPVPLPYRMTGWAFMLRGEYGQRADEELRWWFGDDDIDWTARTKGGMYMMAGLQPHNRFPNGTMTPTLHDQSGRDAETFFKKWGARPW